MPGLSKHVEESAVQNANFLLEWPKNHPRGIGMENVQANCYQNAVLQCLYHLPAFTNWLLYQCGHTQICNDSGKCVLCAVINTLQLSLTNDSSVFPRDLLNLLTSICKHMQLGKQADANEYLTHLLDKLHDCYVEANNRTCVDKITTSPMAEMFRGVMISEVECMTCHSVSARTEEFRDIAVDVDGVGSVQEALKKFFSVEILGSGYKCSHCCTAVDASKKFSLNKIPVILCIQLKIFYADLEKLLKKLACEYVIDLQPHVHKSFDANVDPVYKLRAVVCHSGQHVSLGHYVALADTPQEGFCVFDDAVVHQMKGIVGQPYLLFYQIHSLEIGGAQQLLESCSPGEIADKFLGGVSPEITKGPPNVHLLMRVPRRRTCRNDSVQPPQAVVRAARKIPLPLLKKSLTSLSVPTHLSRKAAFKATKLKANNGNASNKKSNGFLWEPDEWENDFKKKHAQG